MLELREKKQALNLVARIVLIFLAAFGILTFAAYFMLSKNFQNLLTDYTIKLVEAMVDQGVTTIEYELRASQKEAAALADSCFAPTVEGQAMVFPEVSSQADVLRLVYVSKEGTVASDGRQRDISGRQDIVEAMEGTSAVYGPYFNEDQEYVICYSAPVIRDGKIIGVIGLEKDGYYFSSLIKDIRFADSGESYIINSEGTDIAVSRQEHIEWVTEQYNAGKLLDIQDDPVTRSILELEAKGLAGETGVGTYEWEGSLCYVAYAPISPVHWVLFAGIRQEEIASMTRSAFYAAIADGPVPGLCIAMFFILTALIIFWIVSSMKKNAQISEQLRVLANHDPLTGIMNRNSYHAALDALSEGTCRSLACLYIDANGLHEINIHLGHQAGDQMLKAVAEVFGRIFSPLHVYRIGGDEFVVLLKDEDKQDISRKAELARRNLEELGYEISIGMEWSDKDPDIKTMVNLAEEAMQREKKLYYQKNGRERQLRALDQQLEQMVLEKQDADTFLSILAPDFKGVYFVDLGSDTIRHLYIPSYFEEMLKEADDIFSKALLIYAGRIVMPEFRQKFISFCDYGYLKSQLNQDSTPEFTYQKTDGSWIRLRVLKFKTYTAQIQETLWIFLNLEGESHFGL